MAFDLNFPRIGVRALAVSPYSRLQNDTDWLVGRPTMRGWFLPLAPVATVAYFVLFPQQLSVVGAFAARLMHWW
jgi:hypothetical protein